MVRAYLVIEDADVPQDGKEPYSLKQGTMYFPDAGFVISGYHPSADVLSGPSANVSIPVKGSFDASMMANYREGVVRSDLAMKIMPIEVSAETVAEISRLEHEVLRLEAIERNVAQACVVGALVQSDVKF